MPKPRVLFSSGSLHLIDVAHCFELAAEAGFDGMEVMCDDRWSTRDPGYLAHLSARSGLPVLAIHTPFSRNVQGWKRGDEVQRICDSLALAEAVGAEVLVIHLPRKIGLLFIETNAHRLVLPWRSPFVAVKRWIESELPEAQRRTRVKIALENLPSPSSGDRGDATWWNSVAEWSRVHDWLTLDTTHWGTKGVDPLDAYKAARPRVCHVHLSNYDGREHRLPNDGRLDLGALLRAMAADGFSGTISVELRPDSLEYTDAAALRQHLRDSLLFCREHLG